MKFDSHMLTIGDVAKALGLSTARVNQLDAVLRPVRRENGHRRYAAADVERLMKERSKR